MADQNTLLITGAFSGVTDTTVAAFIGKTLTTPEKGLIATLVAAVESYIANQCQRNLKDLGNTDSYFDTVDAGQSVYFTKAYPIKEIRKIEVDGTAVYTKGGSTNQLTLGKDFIVYPDKIVFINSPSSSIDNRQAMKIYYAIENIVGQDMFLAVQQWVSDLFLNREFAGKTTSSISSAGINLNFEAGTIPTYVKQVISVYRKVLI